MNEVVNGLDATDQTALQDLQQNVFGANTNGSAPARQQIPDHVPDLPVLLMTKQPLFPLFSRVIEVIFPLIWLTSSQTQLNGFMPGDRTEFSCSYTTKNISQLSIRRSFSQEV